MGRKGSRAIERREEERIVSLRYSKVYITFLHNPSSLFFLSPPDLEFCLTSQTRDARVFSPSFSSSSSASRASLSQQTHVLGRALEIPWFGGHYDLRSSQRRKEK